MNPIPPPGADDVSPLSSETVFPSPGTLADIPPPAPESDRFEADPLKRKKGFSWKRMGGEGLLVSVTVHLLLLVLGLCYVIGRYAEPKKKAVRDEFDVPGGGRNGRTKTAGRQPNVRVTNVKSPSRIVTINPGASITLSATPEQDTASFSGALSGGDISKGLDGGLGGGKGPGSGPGHGPGKHLVTDFGRHTTQFDGGLVGTYYDTKYKRPADKDGDLEPSDVWQSPPTWHSADNASYSACFPKKPERNLMLDADRYYKMIGEAAGGKDTEQVFEKYFVSPTRLFTTQLWIQQTPSATSPQAFEVADKCKAHFWVVSYRARVSPPTSGRWRFVGAGDDVLCVKVDRKPVLSWYWWNHKSYLRQRWLGAPKQANGPFDAGKLHHFPGATGLGNPNGAGVGEWVEMKKGQFYDFEVLIGDWGGVFRGFLLCEKEGDKYESMDSTVPGKKEPKLYLFRTAADESPRPLAPGLPDYSPDSPVWIARQPKGASVR